MLKPQLKLPRFWPSQLTLKKVGQVNDNLTQTGTNSEIFLERKLRIPLYQQKFCSWVNICIEYLQILRDLDLKVGSIYYSACDDYSDSVLKTVCFPNLLFMRNLAMILNQIDFITNEPLQNPLQIL